MIHPAFLLIGLALALAGTHYAAWRLGIGQGWDDARDLFNREYRDRGR